MRRQRRQSSVGSHATYAYEYRYIYNSQQQNALGYNLSMQGIGDVAIDGLICILCIYMHKKIILCVII